MAKTEVTEVERINSDIATAASNFERCTASLRRIRGALDDAARVMDHMKRGMPLPQMTPEQWAAAPQDTRLSLLENVVRVLRVSGEILVLFERIEGELVPRLEGLADMVPKSDDQAALT